MLMTPGRHDNSAEHLHQIMIIGECLLNVCSMRVLVLVLVYQEVYDKVPGLNKLSLKWRANSSAFQRYRYYNAMSSESHKHML